MELSLSSHGPSGHGRPSSPSLLKAVPGQGLAPTAPEREPPPGMLGLSSLSVWLHSIEGRVFLPGESHGQRSVAGCGPWGHKESDTTERLPLTNYGKERDSSCYHSRHPRSLIKREQDRLLNDIISPTHREVMTQGTLSQVSVRVFAELTDVTNVHVATCWHLLPYGASFFLSPA